MAGKVNHAWHEAHRLPRNATREERLEWHLMHAANCGCRPMPDSIRRELESRGLVEPSPRSLR
jgi:hypothetical protein